MGKGKQGLMLQLSILTFVLLVNFWIILVFKGSNLGSEKQDGI